MTTQVKEFSKSVVLNETEPLSLLAISSVSRLSESVSININGFIVWLTPQAPTYTFPQPYIVEANTSIKPTTIDKTVSYTIAYVTMTADDYDVEDDGEEDIEFGESDDDNDEQEQVKANTASNKRKAVAEPIEKDAAVSKRAKTVAEPVAEVKKAVEKKQSAAKEAVKEAVKDAPKAKDTTDSDNAKAMNKIVQLPSGLQYKDEQLGKGPAIVPGSSVSIRYQGLFTDGKVFDSNMPRGNLLVFKIGAGSVIKGMEQGMIGMRAGGRRRLIIPPKLGYGAERSGPIPPNSTLIFDVEAVKIVNGK